MTDVGIIGRHIATVQRLVVNKRGFIQRRAMQHNWPQADIERERQLLADLEAVERFLIRLEQAAPKLREAMAGAKNG